MIIDHIGLDDGDDEDHDDDDDGGDVQHAGVIPVNGIPSFPAPVRQPEHAQQHAHVYHAHKRIKTKCTQKIQQGSQIHKQQSLLQSQAARARTTSTCTSCKTNHFWDDGMVLDRYPLDSME